MVRAKFKCESKELNVGGEGFQVVMRTVIDGSPENDQFFKYTPSGYLSLGTINPTAADLFIPGNEYYLDFTPAT